MKVFAKLFDVKGCQVLFFSEYVNEEDTTIVHQITDIDGIRADVKVQFDGEDQSEAGEEYMAAIGQEQANAVHKMIAEMVHEGEV